MDAEALEQKTPVKLYRYHEVNGVEPWRFVSDDVAGFYNENEDANKAPLYRLEVGQLDPVVNGQLGFVHDKRNLSSKFYTKEEQAEQRGSQTTLWKIEFASEADFKTFQGLANHAECVNMVGVAPGAPIANLFGGNAGMFAADYLYQDPEDSQTDNQAFFDAEDIPGPSGSARNASAVDMDIDELNISALKIAAGECSYVVTNGSIKPLMNDPEGLKICERPSQAMEVLKASDGSYRSPGAIVLTEGERKMNMLMSHKPSSLFHSDLETGQVVTEYEFQKDGEQIQILNIDNDAKGASLAGDGILTSVQTTGITKWDTRTPQGAVLEPFCGKTDYTLGNNKKFSCMATSGPMDGKSEGVVAVGSMDGRVRLYANKSKQSLNRATTEIPMGVMPGVAPITAIDVTHDGAWVVATTDEHLVLFHTLGERDPKNTSRRLNAFQDRLGRPGKMAAPRVLKLKPEDMEGKVKKAKNAPKKIKMSDGRFDFCVTDEVKERKIIATVGTFTVLWDVEQLCTHDATQTQTCGMAAVMDHYELIEQEEKVIQSTFMANHGTPERCTPVVVATEHEVFTTPFESGESGEPASGARFLRGFPGAGLLRGFFGA